MFRLPLWSSSSIGGNKVMAEELKMLATSPHCAAPSVNSLALPQLKRKRSNSCDPTVDQDAPVATKLRADDAPGKPVAFQQNIPATINNATAAIAHQAPESDSTKGSSSSQHSSHRRQGSAPSGSTPADQGAPSARKVNVDKLRETLEAQLSLEVLLKHNELRLIDQEIAKCQVALEQLRRCAEIPYPGSHVAGGPSQSLSSGTGMALFAPGNGPMPLSPSPWGVTDGPYTRHYSRWLLPDPRFDGGEVDPGTPLAFGGGVGTAAGTPTMEGRSTRGNSGDVGGFLAGKSRAQRGSSGSSRLQSLPNGYPAPKDKSGPMIIRRKSDGVLVKLVCLDCRRDNFSSTQGFINHCRIAHNRNFASHDAAAVACGEPVEVDEAGAVVGGKSETPSTASAGYVHPLIRSAHVIESSASKTPSSGSEVPHGDTTPRKQSTAAAAAASRRASSAVETPRASAQHLPGMRTTPAKLKSSTNDSFMASPDTPHLSSLMQMRGVGLDLDRLVGEAKTAVDLDSYSSDDGESDTEQGITPAAAAAVSHGGQKPPPLGGARVGRQPMRTTASSSTPTSTMSRPLPSLKGIDKTSSHRPFPLESLTPTRATAPYESPYAPTPSRPCQLADLREAERLDPSSNLSPNAMESNQAPSLVSDDDDYEEASDSESPGPSSSEAGDPEEDFSHIDVEGDEDTTASKTTTTSKGDPGMAGSAHPSASLSKSLRRGSTKKKNGLISASIGPLNRGKDEKRVSFASPDSSPSKDKDQRKPSEER